MKIGKKTEAIHDLVYEHFGKLPEDYERGKYVIHHIDGNKSNNHIDNLKCMTAEEHNRYHGQKKRGTKYKKKKYDYIY